MRVLTRLARVPSLPRAGAVSRTGQPGISRSGVSYVGVVVISVTVLFGLTALALAATGRLDRPRRALTTLAAALLLGVGLLLIE